MTNQCPVCSTRKGKRTCPLHGSICTACCGNVRQSGRCPDNCPYVKKSKTFSVNKSITKRATQSEEILAHYEKNERRLTRLTHEIEKSIYSLISRDPYYDDETIIYGLQKALEFFSAPNGTFDEDIMLNRIGVLQAGVKDTIFQFKMTTTDISNKDILATLEAEIFKISSYLLNGETRTFIETISELFAPKQERESGRLII